MTPSPTESNTLAALRTFLLTILPANTDVITAQVNRVPEPQGIDFVLMTPIRRTRLETNIDSADDVSFTGSIAGTTLTVTAIGFGVIEVGATVFGVGIIANTRITAFGTGTGGIGTYTVSASQTISEATLSSGALTVMQPTEVVIQLDVHGPGSADNAQVISTLMRDAYAVDSFAAQTPDYGVVPLLADDPRQMAFVNAEAQYEDRWIIEARLQVNAAVSVPQQYADSLEVQIIDVDVVYPPA